MEQHIIDDLAEIFDARLDQETLNALIRNLDEICDSNKGQVVLKTRTNEGAILKYQGTKYFSLISIVKEKPVIFAGAIERQENNNKIPAVRFRNGNSRLRSVSELSRFPYYKPNWTCVVINPKSTKILLKLMREEVNSYLSKFILPKQNNNFIINPSLIPKQSGSRMTFKEARWMFGLGEPPNKSSNSYSSLGNSDSYITEEQKIGCPRCHSTQITAQKRGFKVGRAIGAGLATGAIGGLIAGAAGKDKIMLTCLKCGHKWNP